MRPARARPAATWLAIGAWVVYVVFHAGGRRCTRTTSSWCVPLLALAAARAAGAGARLFLVLSVSFALNLNLFYGVGERIGLRHAPDRHRHRRDRVARQWPNIGVFVWFAPAPVAAS